MISPVPYIRVRGACEHNLKNLDIDVPRGKLVVFTGVSGSGKSSLAFDTIYAEGQRRYVESLSAYARQFLELMPKPQVESIEGLSPAISIEQKTTSRNPRSIVATVTEIHDYMRLLWARIGTAHSPVTGKPITSQTITEMVQRTMALPDRERILLLAPVVRGRKGQYRKEMAEFLARGFQRVRVDGHIHDLDNVPELKPRVRHDIEVVVDRLVIGNGLEQRLAESFETALSLADGLAVVAPMGESNDMVFSTRFACPESGFTLPEIEPRLFSFNNPSGACPHCDGLGASISVDPALVVPDTDRSINQGAIAPWSRQSNSIYTSMLQTVSEAFDIDLDRPWNKLSKESRDVILFGSGRTKLNFVFSNGRSRRSVKRSFEGVVVSLNRRFRETESAWARQDIGKYQSSVPCTACNAYRLKPEALCVKINGCHIGQITTMSITDAAQWFAGIADHLTGQQQTIAQPVLKEIGERLGFLIDVGLNYLTLSRQSGSLSGGESQRIRLASQIGSGLTGVIYVLDEPSIGLHQRDNDRLLATLGRLRDRGNSVLVVEHDQDAITTADHVIDIGPGAGVHGGRVVAQGDSEQIAASQDSLTGAYLAGRQKVEIPRTRRAPAQWVRVSRARGNNLKNITASFPLGVFVCVTGVSGGGKSTLVMETLYRSLVRRLHGAVAQAQPHDAIDGADCLDKIIHIDQSPIGRTPRSNPVTYTGAFSPIRDWFGGLPESKARGYAPGRFSFNVKGGRCEACSGHGQIRIEMHFLPDVFVTCDQCQGRRYNAETLQVTYKGRSISDVLDMTVAEAREFFAPFPAIGARMEVLDRVGMSYVRLGQSATTLSGGEAQRVKLARELARRATGNSLYILDEPTTGLHFDDVRRLLSVLHELVDGGNTVIVIEHNLDVIKTADWIIDMGPDGGQAGGYVVATGTPEQVAASPDSATGLYLGKYLA